MKNEAPNGETKTGVATALVRITAVLTILALAIDLTTGSLGLVDWIYRKKPMVTVDVVDDDKSENGSQCVKFAFSSLPENFVLERIHLNVIDITIPHVTRIDEGLFLPRASEMQLEIPDAPRNPDFFGFFGRYKELVARPLFEHTERPEVSPFNHWGQKPKFVVHSPVQTDKAEDAFIIYWCPILKGCWRPVSFTVVPTFFDVTGRLILGLDVSTTTGVAMNDGIEVALVAPDCPE